MVCSTLFNCCCIFSCCRRIGQECRGLNILATFGYLYNLLDRLFWLLAYLALGHLGKGHLAAGILSLTTIHCLMAMIDGLLVGQEYYCKSVISRRGSAAAGGDGRMMTTSSSSSTSGSVSAVQVQEELRRWLYVSLLTGSAVIAVGAVLLVVFSFVLYSSLDLRSHVSVRSIQGCWFMLPALLGHLLQSSLHTFLYYQGLSVPSLLALLCGIVVHAVVSILLMMVLGMGVVGSAVAVSCGKLTIAATLFFFVKRQASSTSSSSSVSKEFEGVLSQIVNKVNQILSKCFPSSWFFNKRKNKKAATAKHAALHPITNQGWQQMEEVFNPSRRSHVHGITSSSIAVALREMEMVTRKRSKRVSEQSSRHDGAERDEEEEEEEKAEDDRIGEEGASRADEDDEEAQEQPLLLSDEGKGEGESVEEIHTVSQLLAATKSKYVIDIVRLTKIGFPGVIMAIFFTWPFEISCFVVAGMGNVALTTHGLLLVLVQLWVFAFIQPLSNAMALRLHALFKQKRLLDATYCVRIAILQSAFLSCLFGGSLYLASSIIGFVFTSNEDIVRRIQRMTWYAVLFSLPYAMQSTFQGALKVCGYQLETLWVTIFSIWMVSGAVGFYLAFFASVTYGLEGLWIGMITGSGLQAAAFALQFICLDWQEELKKHVFFSTLVDDPRSMYYDLVLTSAESRHMGGFQLRTYNSIEEEMLELEQLEEIELVIQETDP
eukprot:gene3288-3606_t